MYSSYSTLQRKQLTKQVYTDVYKRPAAAPQRHGKTAALNTGGNRTMRKIRVLDNVYDLITIKDVYKRQLRG